MLTPVSISAFPVRGHSISEDVVGVNTFMQSPLVVAGRPLNAWECYNYKSSVQVTGCNPHRSREKAVERHPHTLSEHSSSSVYRSGVWEVAAEC